MISAEEYLKSLDEKSVWIFTKQKVSDFNEIIRVTSLFESIPDKETTTEREYIENYFKKHHEEFDIETDRHRTLVIPQFFGLITKTPFYKRGGKYNKERTTAIFDKLKNTNPLINKNEFNKIITEQLLKFKIHAIIDTENNNEDYYILPIIFIYKVLKELQIRYNINEISLDHLYTYIMTCNKYEQWEQAVEYIKDNAPISKYCSHYKDLSRIIAVIKNNINLFNITSSTISLNPIFDEYFNSKFMQSYDIKEMHEILYRDVDYSYFLYNFQGFDVNLIDDPQKTYTIEVLNEKEREIIETEVTDEENDNNYIVKIDSIDENNVNVDVAIGAYSVAPKTANSGEIGKKYKRNPLLGKIAIENAYYCCEKDAKHETFISEKNKKAFMEAHHLVPVKYQQEIWNVYKINVDCVENIVSLCPTCHRAFHNGTKEVKTNMIEEIYKKLYPRYKSIGFNISVDEIKKLYKIT